MKFLILGNSIHATSLKYALPNSSLLCNWISKFKENGYNVIEKKRGRNPKAMTKPKKKMIKHVWKDKIKQLEDEILYLKAEKWILKKNWEL